MIKVAIHSILCAGLFYTGWCRIIHTDHETRPAIRLSFSALAVTALLLGISPWAWMLWPWYEPAQITWAWLAILANFLAIQISTAVHWRGGIPRGFKKGE